MSNEELLAAIKKMAEEHEKAHPCPGCGRCPTCGRGGWQYVPYVPYVPAYPYTLTWTYPIYTGGAITVSGNNGTTVRAYGSGTTINDAGL